MANCKVTLYPMDKEIEIPIGTSLKKAMDLAGLDFDFPCGGRGRCGKCRLQIREGSVPPSDADYNHLDDEEIQAGFRLACAVKVQEDLVVELPLADTGGHKILVDAAMKEIEIKPHLSKTYREVPRPSIEDQQSDWDRLRDALGSDNVCRISLSALQALPGVLRENKFCCTAVVSGNEVVGMEAGDTTERMLGMAFDIGTTTVVGYLMDLLTGKELGVASSMNPQTKYGADVISRITYVGQEAGGLERLQSAIIEVINRLIEDAVHDAGYVREDVYAVSVVGNSCMHHLFLGLNPKHIALAPYVPVTGSPQDVDAHTLGIHINPAGKVYVLPNIAGFVGADTVGVILATEMDQSSEIRLAIDIGTNGEMVLGTRDRLLACSTAAGPAFEGAQISCGMRGTKGAVDSVQLGEDIVYTTIGGEKPKGICGSGLIDAIAVMLAAGIIDHRGRILSGDQLSGTRAERFASRVVENEGMTSFLLAAAEETVHGRPLFITQRDVRELQLAKGAIAAGVEILLEKYGIMPEDVFEVILAGAFGNYLDKHSACAIGLIPSSLEDRVKPVGNAAGTGAKVALLSAGEYRRAAHITSFVEYEELAAYPKFTEIFSKALYFPRVEQHV
ncbi:MAG TPA: DUF4445 domain-containing protein [Syntrophomonadaceae bacterium]|nr:DUF4445 domain-containing protein [Syntrophomonadaceae bacterium]